MTKKTKVFTDEFCHSALANKIMDVIVDFEWGPPINVWDIVSALALVMKHLTFQYEPFEEIDN